MVSTLDLIEIIIWKDLQSALQKGFCSIHLTLEKFNLLNRDCNICTANTKFQNNIKEYKNYDIVAID